MKGYAKTILLLAGMISFAWSAEDDKYTTKYDDLDVDAIISSPRLLKNYVNCVLEKGPCTAEGTEIKANIPDAIQTDCSKCSEKQKKLTDKVLQYLMDNEPEYWKPLQVKYDPSETYIKKYLESKKSN